MTKADIRRKFKQEVFERDNHTCKVCNTKRAALDLNAHHITDRHEMPNGGYVLSNGITVCEKNCHMLVEEFHLSGKQRWEEGLHPDDLYKMINSSYEQAFLES